MGGIKNPLKKLLPGHLVNWGYAILAVVIMLIIYYLLERAVNSPWGRLQMAIKEEEHLTEMLGKNVWNYRMQSLVLGSAIIGVGGAVFAHYQGYVNPQSYNDIMMCFLPLLMVVAGGTGNNRGSIAGAFLIWTVWSLSEIGAGYLPISSTKIPYMRTLVVGLVIISVLRWRPTGLIGRKRAISSSGQEKAAVKG
ncbi:MAG: branched-chain amino acid ABC transporter permease, partial [Halanaerobiales bacterium]